MLYYLFFYLLRPHLSPLNVFRYITVRTALASLTALLLSLLSGPWVIARLRDLQVKQYIREEGPKRHQGEGGDAHDGRRADRRLHRASHLALGGSAEPVRAPCARCDCSFRRHWVCRRLQQSCAPAQSGPYGAQEISCGRF